LAGCCECGDEPSGSGATELVSLSPDTNQGEYDDEDDGDDDDKINSYILYTFSFDALKLTQPGFDHMKTCV
jgi:hypothetical protein